ncbi:hypothetical protein DFH08DRAFT_890270 [Mycena albidolilacea]|uniref:Uncharacterized protein n=1 Tax=Mycena albidolilacea TaxID=1033008 RepID=A0AAD6ZEZ7_9AGAR|nr:hypothetical protein DFH08DRAFT_890270 [Mycena albidolilacea]
MDNTTELELSTITVLRTNNDPSHDCTIDVSSTDVSSGSNFENNLPRPSLHLGAHGTPSTAQIIGLTRHSGAVISREDLEEELRRRDNQINEFKDLFISRMEDHEKEQSRKDNQLSELMNRIAALEGNLLHMHNTTEPTPSDTIVSSEVLGNNNDPARTIDVSEDNLPCPSLHLGAPGAPSTAQIIGLTRCSGKAVISREDLQKELRRRDKRRKDNQLSELMNRVAALEVKLADRNPPSVKITPWRAFNTLLVLGLGVYKSVGTYQGQTTGPTTVDWIGSLVWATIVYWVSLYEPLVDDDPDSEEVLVWIFCRDLAGILPVLLALLFFTVAAVLGYIKLVVLVLRPLGPHSGVLLSLSISLALSLVWALAVCALGLYLLPKLGSLLAKWRRHIPPFFCILPFDSSDWMFSYKQWVFVFPGLFVPAFEILYFWDSLNWQISFSDKEPPQRALYIFILCSGFACIAMGLLRMLHRLLTRGRNGGRVRLPLNHSSWHSRLRIHWERTIGVRNRT